MVNSIWETPGTLAYQFWNNGRADIPIYHSSVLAWRIPGMGEPGGLPSLGSHRVGHDKRLSSSSSRLPIVPSIPNQTCCFTYQDESISISP